MADVTVGSGEGLDGLGWCALQDGLFEGFLRREEQFRDHVPVDAPESLVGEEGARTTRKDTVMESVLKELQEGRALGGDQVAVGCLGLQRVQSPLHVLGVPESAIEMEDALVIFDDQARVTCRDEGCHQA